MYKPFRYSLFIFSEFVFMLLIIIYVCWVRKHKVTFKIVTFTSKNVTSTLGAVLDDGRYHGAARGRRSQCAFWSSNSQHCCRGNEQENVNYDTGVHVHAIFCTTFIEACCSAAAEHSNLHCLKQESLANAKVSARQPARQKRILT